MMAEPLMIVEGAVIGVRRVDVPERVAQGGLVRKDGTTYDLKFRAAESYGVMGLAVQAAYDGSPVMGVTSVVEVRLGDYPAPGVGEVVRLFVSTRIDRFEWSGTWRNVAVHTVRGAAGAEPLTLARPSSPSPSSVRVA